MSARAVPDIMAVLKRCLLILIIAERLMNSHIGKVDILEAYVC